MSWNAFFKLGLAGQEIDFQCQVADISVVEDNIEVEQRNLQGANLRSYIRTNVPTISITILRLTDDLLAILRGLRQALTPLNFIYNTTLRVKYLMATSLSTTSVVIPPTSASGITIAGVFLQSDTNQTGTNYYSGGSTFDPTTGTITLASALPGANTAVWVNYSFSGLQVTVKIDSVKPHRGPYAGLWQANVTLEGA